MALPNPKAFICHASEDKARFVIPFGTALRANGVDAWVDKFEIHSGDSIVQKIFSQGIENAKAVIAVISAASLVKPWVQNEIDVAFVRRIEGKCKLIPVILDNATPPTCLSALRWEPVADPKNFDAALHNILLSIFDQYEKPPLGRTPAFVTTEVATIPGISLVDSKVLIACCRLSEKMDQVGRTNFLVYFSKQRAFCCSLFFFSAIALQSAHG
jgi:hypothetical protein